MPAEQFALVKKQLDSKMGVLESLLPEALDPKRFALLALATIKDERIRTAASQNPRSYVSAVLEAASLGLELTGPLGHGYLIPRNERIPGTKQRQLTVCFQPGYKGLVKLAHDSGIVKYIDSAIVYEHDAFQYWLGTDPQIRHDPNCKSKRGFPTHVYAVARLFNAKAGETPPFVVMSWDEIEQVKKLATSLDKWETGPWFKHPDQMAKKTVIRRLLNGSRFPLTGTRVVRAVAAADIEEGAPLLQVPASARVDPDEPPQLTEHTAEVIDEDGVVTSARVVDSGEEG